VSGLCGGGLGFAAGLMLGFVLQQPGLALEAAAVASEGAVRADDTMAGDDDADGVLAVGEADAAYGGGVADSGGELGVSDGRAGGDLLEGGPDLALEEGSGGLHGDVSEGGGVAGEVLVERVFERGGRGGWGEVDCGCSVVEAEEAVHAGLVLGPVEGAEMAFGVGDEEGLADGGGEAVEEEGEWGGHGYGASWRDQRG